LLLVHVEQRLESPGEGYYSREFYRTTLAGANRRMEQLQLSAGTRARVLIEAGNVADATSKAANRERADLLFIGRGSPTENGRLGANTYDIIRKSGCSVVSV
jgi:nucleotide-binding universal stress UspA family protein